MKFSAREDIDVPVDAVFEMSSDVERFERLAMRRGVDVRRLDQNRALGPGMQWEADFELRGRPRQVVLEMVRFDRPNEMVLDIRSSGLQGQFVLETMPLSQSRSRLAIALEIRPKTFSARLMVQSLRLAKASLTRRFKSRVAEYAEGVEASYRLG